jgi:hypothetical protein
MGKTTLMTEVVCRMLLKDVKRCFAVCPTWYQQPALKKLRQIKGAFPRNRVSQVANEEVFERIFQLLNKEKINGKFIPTLLIVDDCAAESSLNKGNHGAYARLAIASPHLQLSICTVVQKLVSCSPMMRENAEGIISFIPSRVGDVDILVDEFNPCPYIYENKRLLLKILERCWKAHRFCFIWREKLTGKVAYYKGLGEEVELPREEEF